MNIIAPWSLANYTAGGGAHPLYRSLASLSGNEHRIVVPRDLERSEYDQLSDAGIYERRSVALPEWARNVHGRFAFRAFVAAQHTSEINYLSNLAGDAELHHTTPATRGDRPYFLHLKSVEGLLAPMLRDGTEADDVSRARNFYRVMLESPCCVGIASHLPQTLSRMSAFFQSSVIDAKLAASPVGLDASYIASRRVEDESEFRCLVLGAADRRQTAFVRRGGMASLAAAIALLKSGFKARFHFCATRPAPAALKAQGIDTAALRRFEGNEIVWLQDFLAGADFQTLAAKAHVLLLPSAHLHATTIMTALTNGVVPIVADAKGVERFINDRENGIILGGIRAACWSTDEHGIDHYDPQAFDRKADDIATALERELRALAAAPDKRRQMANYRESARRDFCGEAFAHWLVSETSARAARVSAVEKIARPWAGDRWLEDLQHAHFKGPSLPHVRFEAGSENRIYRRGQAYVRVPEALARDADADAFWSPLRIARARFGDAGTSQARLEVYASFADALLDMPRMYASRVSSLAPSDGAARALPRISLPERVARALRGHPVAYSAARAVYRAFNRGRGPR